MPRNPVVRRKTQLGLSGSAAATVSTIVSNRATRDNRIRDCLKSPLKSYLIRRVSMIASISGFERSFTRSSSLSSPMSTTVVST